jgi:phosphotransferase system  glucose/maltose/N-acetylglucosamine-specific IIC component
MHAILTGVSAFFVGLFGIQLGFGFSAGLIDYLLSIPKSLEIIKENKTGFSAVMAHPV